MTTDNPPYLDPNQPVRVRVQDLLSRLTLAEKVSQMSHPARAIPRLGIPAYNFWSEALHGVARNGRATVFPAPIGMAAAWDPDLIQRAASAIGDEARAKYHAVLRKKGETGLFQGLTFWSPNINLFRDPRWGRGQETWGEDPFLTGEMGAAFVRGLQGDHPRYLKVAACAKHYAVHSGPEKLRHVFNALVSKRDLYGTYLPAFKKLVTQAKVEAVMSAYNRTLDEPCSASQLLLKDILRGEWGFEGHVVSDCGALSDIHNHHKVTRDAAESAALALTAGCDLGCDCVFEAIPEAIQRGLINESDVDRALGRTLTTRFKLGMFDPPDLVPYAAIPPEVVGCEAHCRLAYETALRSVVLLKNKAGILPIRPDVNSLFVTGPAAASLDVLLGNYNGLNSNLTTLVEGIVAAAPEGMRVEYRHGCTWLHPNLSPINWAFGEAAQAGLAIVCAGLAPLLEGEEGESILSSDSGDRTDIALPAVQADFIKQLAIQGVKIILVLTGGSPIALGEVADLADAILFAWYPGQEGGRAVADLLFGQQSPSGKLPITFPRSTADLPPFENYAMAGRTYRYATAAPLFPFGFGLSYTRFVYRDLALSHKTLPIGAPLTLEVTLSNAGAAAGEEVVQVYLSHLTASTPVPLHSLVAFRRLRLEPGESRRLAFTIQPEQMVIYDDDGQPRLEAGRLRLIVGGCSPSVVAKTLGAPQPASATFKLQ